MARHLPADFMAASNFELAWQRVFRGSNLQYKRFFAHLFPSYEFAHPTIVRDLIMRVRSGLYEPSKATTVYLPKPSRVLRPITLLSLNDQVVYQAIANYVANRFFRSLRPNYGVKTFGAQFAGRRSQFFYRPWKRAYRAFNTEIRTAYLNERNVLADFDLVSFFDLIDHKILRAVLERRVHSGELLDLFCECLEKWTSGTPNIFVRGHGIPQGPEPSAFFAEILLSDFDKTAYRHVTYLRYVDDIKLLARDSSPVRRALLKLDLQAKRLGLVPQAQKIALRRVTDINAELKSVPSNIAGGTTASKLKPLTKSTIRRLRKLLRNSVERRRGELVVRNETHFKFALHRLPASKRVLRSIEPLFHSRPDLSPALSHYAARFANNLRCALLLHEALKSDPVFDAAGGDYVMALDHCAPKPEPRKIRRLVSRLMMLSEEKSLLLSVPTKFYLYKRAGKSFAASAIENEVSPTEAGLLIFQMCIDPRTCCLVPRDLETAIRKFARHSTDDDLARYCTYVTLAELKSIPPNPHPAGALLLRHLGLPIPPLRISLLPGFFRDLFGVAAALDWERLMGKRAHSEAQRRAVAIRGRRAGNPSILVTILDSFNDLLVQRFSRKHKGLRVAFKRAAGNYKIPDFGAWLRNPTLQSEVPKAWPILLDCHDLRIRADVAHATHKKSGQFTHPITYKEKDKIIRKLRVAYRELMTEWSRL
jgi:hypothetical protein